MSKFWAWLESREDRSILDKEDTVELNGVCWRSRQRTVACGRNVDWNWDTWNTGWELVMERVKPLWNFVGLGVGENLGQ